MHVHVDVDVVLYLRKLNSLPKTSKYLFHVLTVVAFVSITIALSGNLYSIEDKPNIAFLRA